MTDHRTGFLGAVGRFFFTPTDPTVLGLMRIIAGLLLLYTHAVYSLTLKEFFGPDAWWDQRAGNQQRRDVPFTPTMLGWDEFIPTVRVDDVPHRRSAEIEFLRSVPLEKAERREKLRYVERLARLPWTDFNDGLHLANSAARVIDSEQDAKVRQALTAKEIPESGVPVHIPKFVRDLPPQDRLAVWNELLTFLTLLPTDLEKHEYVLTWLANSFDRREDLYRFLIGDKHETQGGVTRDLSLPADPKERAEFLDYLDTWGGDPRQAAAKGTSVFSVWYHLTDPTAMWAVHITCLVVFVLFTVGLWTRVTSVLAWAVSLNYIHRGQLILFGQDTMQTILITYLMIGPCGAALSLDALRKRYRAAKALMGSGGRSVPWAEAALAGPPRTWLANFATRLVQINFCLIYASSGISKLKGTTWWEHSAAWLVMANPEFGLTRYQAYEWMLRQLIESRFLIAAIAGMVTVFTLVTEIGFPFLVWTRLRPLMVSLSALLHLGIAIMMGLAVFGMYMYALVLAYFPAKLIRERVAPAAGSGRKLTVRYDSRDPAAVRKAALIRSLDVTGQVTFVDVSGKGEVDHAVHLTDPDGPPGAGPAQAGAVGGVPGVSARRSGKPRYERVLRGKPSSRDGKRRVRA
ncbi:MAG TPA: hypothetical protein VKD72_02470 [Gemmataceae bacterium]|nr:hypothetical protein [Gemmataceae bacterium]